jgi:hypothetical protein
MAQEDSIPPVPVPPPGSGVPPVEPPPAAPAAQPDPYAAPTAPPAAAGPYAPPPAPGTQPPPAYGAPAYGSPGYAPAPAGPPQGLAIASLACGIGGLLLMLVGFGFLASLAAVITGHMAQKRQPYARGFWITGLITGYIGLALGLLFGLFILLGIIAAFASVSYIG